MCYEGELNKLLLFYLVWYKLCIFLVFLLIIEVESYENVMMCVCFKDSLYVGLIFFLRLIMLVYLVLYGYMLFYSIIVFFGKYSYI